MGTCCPIVTAEAGERLSTRCVAQLGLGALWQSWHHRLRVYIFLYTLLILSGILSFTLVSNRDKN